MSSERRPRVTTGMLRYHYESLQQLVEISLIMNSTLALEPLLKYIMDAAVEIGDAEAASILLVEPGTQELYFAAATSPDAEALMGIKVPLEGSIAGAILAEDEALIINDVSADPRHFGGVDEKVQFKTRSILGVPMRIREKLIGVLEVLNKRIGSFNQEDVDLITILAAQAAVAIDNAQLIQQLQDKQEELQSINRLKSDFISIASHELRTPLGVILGYATFLKEDAQGEVGEHADAVLRSALHLRSLIESMTNLRYVRGDQAELVLREVLVNDVLRGAYDDIDELAQAKDQILVLELLDEDVYCTADRAKLQLALTNILNNAVRFTPRGGVIICSAERRGSEVWMVVRDNGIGIAAGELEKIFEEFYQVEDPLTRAEGGLGLGLAITRAIVEAHHGRVWAQSPGRDEGSRFTIALPLEQPETMDEAPAVKVDRSKLVSLRLPRLRE